MDQQFIKCPNCGTQIELTKAFTAQLDDKLRGEYDKRLEDEKIKQAQQNEVSLRKRQRELDEREKAIDQTAEKLKEEYNKKYLAEKTTLENRVRKETQESVGIELKDLKSQVEEKDRKLKEALDNELKMRQQQRELEEREKNVELVVQRKISDESKKIWASAVSKVNEDHRLKDAEKEKKIADMLQQIEDLKRKAEQGSQQSQGEVLEIELENLLRATFRSDDIQSVPKGIKGADVIQKVYTKLGNFCGTILWESKRTKSWSDAWLQKLKDDQREEKANVAVIVSIALPKNIKTIGLMNGIWVSDFSTVVGLATALREGMIEVARTKASLVGKSDKTERLYAYLSGQEFRQRIEAIVESFATMKSELDNEKIAIEKIWSKREQQITRVLKNTAGLYGDLQGIIGGVLQPISRLELSSANDTQVTT